MSWKLKSIESQLGESPGKSAKFQDTHHFEGSKFLVKKNTVHIPDYDKGGISSKNKEMMQFATDVKKILGIDWKHNTIRIRGNGDCYATGNQIKYVGNVVFDNIEPFVGYRLHKDNFPISQVPQLFSGPQNHRQIGEKWIISQKKNMEWGIKRKKNGVISWSKSNHTDFIQKARKILVHRNPREGIPFRITNYGLITYTIDAKSAAEWYNIDINAELKKRHMDQRTTVTVNSMFARSKRAKQGSQTPNFWMVIGHIDDLMDGKIPIPDLEKQW